MPLTEQMLRSIQTRLEAKFQGKPNGRLLPPTSSSTSLHSVVSCCKLNNTRECDEHLFGQVSTCTGRSLSTADILLLKVHLLRYARPQMDDVMSYNLLTIIHYFTLAVLVVFRTKILLSGWKRLTETLAG